MCSNENTLKFLTTFAAFESETSAKHKTFLKVQKEATEKKQGSQWKNQDILKTFQRHIWVRNFVSYLLT